MARHAPGGIFISYRRRDTGGVAGRLYDRLSDRFGDDRVFMDVEIEPGEDFIDVINNAVSRCAVLLVVIGPRWRAVAEPDNAPGTDASPDFVHFEIEVALARGVRVIPVLIDDARMPLPAELPPSIAGLSRRHAFALRNLSFKNDVAQLVSHLDGIVPPAWADPDVHGDSVPEPIETESGPPTGRPAGDDARRRTRRAIVVIACVVVVVLGGLGIWRLVNRNGSAEPTHDGVDIVTTPSGSAEADFCTVVDEQWPDIQGTKIDYLTDFVGEVMAHSIEPFEKCTGVQVEFRTATQPGQLSGLVAAGTPPDVAETRQPGLLRELVRQGAPIQPVGGVTLANLVQDYDGQWREWGMTDGVQYAVPAQVDVKSLIWYSPSVFQHKGYSVPETYDELIELSNRIAADGTKPWCAGLDPGWNGAWPATDWLEDFVLRDAGEDVYDKWVDHRIAFDDPRIAAALDRVGGILKNPDYVNGGFGGVTSITSTGVPAAAKPILDGRCLFHKQSSLFELLWPGVTVGPEGEVNAFYLPSFGAGGHRPVLVGGSYVAVLKDRPEARALQYYLTTPEWSDTFAAAGGGITARNDLNPDRVGSPVARTALQLLHDPQSVIRFDGSDLMPARVGLGAASAQLYDWIAANQDTATTLANVEAVW